MANWQLRSLSEVNSNTNNLSSSGKIEYRHGLAEDTKLSKGEVDMVTISLVAHELPKTALRFLYKYLSVYKNI